MTDGVVDLNAARKARAGRQDTGRCPGCGAYRLLCIGASPECPAERERP